MYTIKNNTHYELIIKNSKFITYLYKINSLDEVNKLLSDIRMTEKDANHYCYAYILGDIKKASDDGEPSNTAGLPILKVLEKKDLNNILVIVVRYFGGIKLGAGGLVRAYTKSVTNTINDDNIISLVEGYNIDIEFNYQEIKTIDYLLKDINIKNKEFGNIIKYNLDIPKNFLDKIKLSNIKYHINRDILIEDYSKIKKN